MNQKKVDAMTVLFSETMHFKAQVNSEEAKAFFEAIGFYGEFEPEKGCRLIDEIDAVMPVLKYPGNNPNNGKTVHTYSAGRAYKPLLEISLVKNYNFGIADGRAGKFVFYEKLKKAIRRIAKKAQCYDVIITEEEAELKVYLCWVHGDY